MIIRNRKIVKLRPREIYQDLANTVAEHKISNPDHEIGTENSCELCRRYYLLGTLRAQQEELLKQYKLN